MPADKQARARLDILEPTVAVHSTVIANHNKRLLALEAEDPTDPKPPPDPEPEPPGPDPESPPEPPEAPNVDVWIGPGDLTQQTINGRSEGTVFGLHPGTYTPGELSPKSGQVFYGPGAHLDGRNNTRFAFKGAAVGLHLWGLELTGYIAHDDRIGGAIHGWDGVGWILQDLNVHHNAVYGAAIRRGTRVIGGSYSDNGIAGIVGTQTSNIVLDGVTLERNNTRREDPLSATGRAGAMKFTVIDGLVIRNCTVRDNRAPGVWADITCLNALIEVNVITSNDYAGVFYEISTRATIIDNVITDNGHSSPWWHGAGILLSTAADCLVARNVLSGNRQGIIGLENESRRAHGLSSNLIRHNEVDMSNGFTGLVDNPVMGNDLVRDQGNVFRANVYTGAPRFYAIDREVSFAAWQAMGQDVGSTIAA